MIKLRALEPLDIELLYKWENDVDTWQYGNTLVPYSRYQLEQYVLSAEITDIYTTKQLRLMVDIDAEDDTSMSKTIGMVDLFDFDPAHSRAGVGILIAPEYRSKGFASEALKALIAYTFHTLKLHQLFCDIPVSNVESLKVFQKNGFQIIGIKKDWLQKDQYTWQDVCTLQLINI